ncbi:MAG: tetratricopeptide repeat protein, partial [Ktedonobacteraceae bacterium]|nr:tetratricopeptide repeat protein [Ktedonobacteraceae bacterium]
GALVGHVPESMMRTIQTRAAGNPFFAEELARSIEAQVAAPAQATQADTAAYPLPDTIAAVLGLRISRLSSPCQRLLGNAAVLGGSFEFNVIREMEASGSSPADEDTVLDLLDEALQAGVLTEEGRGTRISYHFWHPLLVSLLYEGLSGAKRVLLHRRAAAVLQRMYAAREEAVAATITHHLVTGGGEAGQIVHYATLAGNSAYALSAYPDAERYYRLAVENTNAQAAFQSAAKRLHLAYLLEQLAECLRVRGSFEEARALYERALDTRRFPRPFASAAEEQYEAEIQALLWSEVGRTWYYTGDNLRAQEYLDRGEQTLREAGVVGGPAWARLYYQRGYISWQDGRYEEARQEGHEALRLFEGEMQREGQQAGRPPEIAPPYPSHEASSVTPARRILEGDPVDLVRTYRFLGALAGSIGQPDEALTHLNTALRLIEQHDHKREVAHICCNIGHAHLQKAEHELAMTFFQRSLRLAEQLGDAPLEGVVFSNLGEMSARTGKLEEAESWFNRAIAQAEQINDQAYVSMWHAYLAPILQDLDRLDDAEACIFRALTVGRAINNTPCIGLALVALGHMRIAQVMLVNESQDGTPEERATQADEQIPGELASKRLATGEQERLLRRARTTLQHALGLVGLEAETRTRGELALAQVSLLARDLDSARQQASHALQEADQYEMTRLSARAQALLGSILAAQGVHEQAAQHFEQAINTCRERGLRLDYARALHSYAQALLSTGEEGPHRQALAYLHEARQIFSECHAALDLTLAEQTNAWYALLDSDNRTR